MTIISNSNIAGTIFLWPMFVLQVACQLL